MKKICGILLLFCACLLGFAAEDARNSRTSASGSEEGDRLPIADAPKPKNSASVSGEGDRVPPADAAKSRRPATASKKKAKPAVPDTLKALRRIQADSWSVSGGNYILSGHVAIRYKNITISCDKAIFNPDLQDLEAVGNCRLQRRKVVYRTVTVKELAELEKDTRYTVEVLGLAGDVFGEKKITIAVDGITESISCQRVAGNLKTGYFRFDRLRLRSGNLVCRADSGERFVSGVIELVNGEISSCPYLESDNAHFSIGASKLRLTPNKSEFQGTAGLERDTDEYMVTLWHGVGKIYGLPVFYFPVICKPRDEDPGLFGFQIGKKSKWGYFFSGYKRFNLSEYPYSSVKLRGDWYSLRGIGYGAEGRFVTENSRTDLFAYGLYDIRPYETDDYDKYRLKVPHARFDLRLSNVTHITPYLDFRGVIEYSSDPYFTRDFFSTRFNTDAEPATFAALEQQFDYLTAALYFRPRIMTAYTTVEKLPEVLFSAQRQRIFDSPFYYQGDLTAGYYRMKWIQFDEKLPSWASWGSKLKDYDSFRLDTTHFLYLPLRTPYFVFVPRAGVKVTAYSKTSKESVSEDDLIKMFAAASPTNMTGYYFRNYDGKGGSKVRLASELGAELSTKIHGTWSDVRNRIMLIDGLRHVIRPYINYTFIGVSNLGRNHIYYFDEIDRIEGQSFFRIGVENRLETRAGDDLRELLRLENFIDIHTTRKNGMNPVGDFCTLLSLNPIKGLTLSTEISIDAGGNNDKMPDDYRRNRNVGRTGIDLKWLNRWNLSLRYSPVEHVVFFFSYDYIRPYNGRNPYSMGSTLTMLESTRWFRKDWYKHSETFTVGVSVPVTPDYRTFASFALGYDFIEGHISSCKFMLRRLMHCVEVAGILSFDYDSDEHKKRWDTSFSISARLTGLDSPIMGNKNAVLSSLGGGSGGFGL